MKENNLTKEELELYKLNLEIKYLKVPWFQKPSYLAILIPSLIALLSFFLGIFTGFFDLRTRELNLKRQEIALEIKLLDEQKHKLSKSNEKLLYEKNTINKHNNYLEQDLYTLVDNGIICKSENRYYAVSKINKDTIEINSLLPDLFFSNIFVEDTTLKQNEIGRINCTVRNIGDNNKSAHVEFFISSNFYKSDSLLDSPAKLVKNTYDDNGRLKSIKIGNQVINYNYK